MQFVSIEFFAFLLISIAGYFLIPKKVKYIWLLLCSWAFYFYACDKFLLLLIIVTLIAYVAGRLLDSDRGASTSGKRAVLVTSIVLLVGLLVYFKYTGFLLTTVSRFQLLLGLPDSMPVLNIILPLGISFYLFQAIGYIIDCYRGTIKAEKNYLYVALFISFFAQIMAGPIERAGNMLPQYKNPKPFSYDSMRDGLLLILWGYFQKIIIADRLSIVVGSVYGSIGKYTGTTVLLATICYTLQIYCDFAGYSNIAIGSAKIMGIDLMKNFTHPYLSGSVAEFWRNWHISLSTWFRDYLYIPLGGNRKGKTRKLMNLIIVFAVSGLWHGAAWTFVIWGLLHGFFQVMGILLKPVRDYFVNLLRIERKSFSHRLLKILCTFMLVNIGWIFFRADTFALALTILIRMWKFTPWVLFDGTLFSLGLTAADVYLLLASLLLLLAVDICNKRGILVRDVIYRQGLWLRWLIYLGAAIYVITCGIWGPGYDASAFIYSSF